MEFEFVFLVVCGNYPSIRTQNELISIMSVYFIDKKKNKNEPKPCVLYSFNDQLVGQVPEWLMGLGTPVANQIMCGTPRAPGQIIVAAMNS